MHSVRHLIQNTQASEEHIIYYKDFSHGTRCLEFNQSAASQFGAFHIYILGPLPSLNGTNTINGNHVPRTMLTFQSPRYPNHRTLEAVIKAATNGNLGYERK